MKKIILIGDSIRMGYDKYVKEALSKVAEVYYPNENCRFAEYVLRYAHEWKRDLKMPTDADLVHWNAGLWDALEIFDDGPLTNIEHYISNVKRIDRRLRLLFPKAKIVFATSTAVRENGYSGEFKRHNSIIEEYNRAATEALSDTDTVINDLYEITKDIRPECCSDMTHYNTKEGTEFVGGKVLSVICPMLGISPSEINISEFSPEKYSKKSIGF